MAQYKCSTCDASLQSQDMKYGNETCTDCFITYHVEGLVRVLGNAHITFEEVIRRLISGVDK